MPDDNIKDVIKHHETHSSVKYIKNKFACNTTFSFEEVTQDEVYHRLRKTNCNKSALARYTPNAS